MKKDRRDTCKCGRIFYWSTDENKATCPHCKTVYRVDCDDRLVYWLQEEMEFSKRIPFTTVAR